MAIQFEVRPEIADKLTALAKARGVSVDELLLSLLSKPEPSEPEIVEPSLEEFDRDMDAIAEGAEQLPTEYQGTYPRADIYADHD
jgi:methyl coenzyme M reductase gamma subunit